MTALLEELVRQNVRTLGEALSRRQSVDAGAQDAEDALRMALRCYEDVRVAWDRFCDELATGQDAAGAREGFRSALAMFDEWLQGASRVQAFVEGARNRTGHRFAAWEAFQEAVEKVRFVRQSAAEAGDQLAGPLPEVAPEALAEARTFYGEGKFKDLGDILAHRMARKP